MTEMSRSLFFHGALRISATYKVPCIQSRTRWLVRDQASESTLTESWM